MGPYVKSMVELKIVARKVQGSMPSLREMQSASDMLETVAERLTKQGVPVSRVVNQLVGIFNQGK